MSEHARTITRTIAIDTAEQGFEGPIHPMGHDFDAARVFSDPVRYLDCLGLRAELVATHDGRFPAAA